MARRVTCLAFGLGCWLAVSARLPGLAQVAEGPRPVEVFTAGKEGYHTFRIPALLVTPKGTLLAFCEGRKDHARDAGDIDLVLKRSGDGGKTWGRLELVYEEGGAAKVTIGNPCPVVEETTGVIWLPFCRDNRDVFVTSSKDDGRTWSRPRDITKVVKKAGWGWYATGPGVGIQVRHGPHKGRLVIPCDYYDEGGGKKVKHSHVIFSDDRGATWNLGGVVGPHLNECQVVELADGKGTLLLNLRNYWAREGGKPDHGGVRAAARSHDGGLTWTPVEFDRTLVEPICQASLIRWRWPDKGARSVLAFSNPASAKARVDLTVRLSYDEGKTWPVSRLLHKGPSAYSCLAALPGGDLGCLFEGGKRAYEKILFSRISREWLEGGKDG
jgi:sialidase-1